MTISSVKTGAIGDSLLAGNAAFNPSSYESIATITGTGSSGNIVFSSIPSTYTHLQLRYNSITGDSDEIWMRLNGDGTSSYATHRLTGNGSAASAAGTASLSFVRINGLVTLTGGIYPTVGIIDIHNYSSTSINKTVRGITGNENNGSGEINLISGVWLKTDAITSLRIQASGTNFTSSSTFSLYGIKGA
jgi:hypothetical protein